MTEDSKRTQRLPMLTEEMIEKMPRSSRRPNVLDPDPQEPWADEEASTRNTDAAIPLPPITPTRTQQTQAAITVVSGPSTGRVFTIHGAMVLGRGREAQVRLDDAGASRAHARITPADGGVYVLEDLGSLNGTFVDGKRIERTELRSGDRINIGPNIVVTFAILDAQAEKLVQQLYESSVRDPLTRAYNRRYLVERLASEIAYAVRHRTPLGLILLDLDHFKRINDTYGHLMGDEVLRDVSALVQRFIRVEDVFARFGGEEFVVLVRGIEHANVGRFAERIRAAVEALEIAGDAQGVGTVRVTLSAGYASLGEVGTGAGTGAGPGDASAEALLRLADARMYRAKEEGRNRVSGA
jgi:two-component system, cell cycle response regulator